MKLVGTDYDGTLCINHQVSDKNLQAIHNFRKQGHYFGIVTGRSPESIFQEIKRWGLELDYLIANNGGVIFNQEMQLIKSTWIDFDRALEIIDYIRTCDCVSYVINDGYYRAKVVVNPKLEDKKYGKTTGFKSADEILSNKRIAQLVISLHDDHNAKEIQEYINTHFQDVAIAYTNINCVDIAPVGISKAEGLRFLANHFKLNEEQIYTIGDAMNDFPMLTAFHGYCVNNASDELKEKIGCVVEDVAELLEIIQ